MAQRLRKLLLKDTRPPSELLTAIREVRERLDNARERFDLESDSELIEACVYELQALQVRYQRLLRMAKQQGVQSPPLLAEERLFCARDVIDDRAILCPAEGELPA